MKSFKNILLFFIPFALMILVNENSNSIEPKKCSWKCHNNTQQCKENHTNFLKSYIKTIDVLYNAIIVRLSNTGNYKLANVILLVILWPLLMLFLFIKIISFSHQIKKLKNE